MYGELNLVSSPSLEPGHINKRHDKLFSYLKLKAPTSRIKLVNLSALQSGTGMVSKPTPQTELIASNLVVSISRREANSAKRLSSQTKRRVLYGIRMNIER